MRAFADRERACTRVLNARHEALFQLALISRGEPGADLFLLPPGYQLAPQFFQLTPKKEE